MRAWQQKEKISLTNRAGFAIIDWHLKMNRDHLPSSMWRSRVAGRARTIGNRVTVKSRSRVRIPPSPPKKHLNFDTMGIKIAVLSFCLNGLISRAFRLLRCLLLPGRTIARRQSSAQRHRMAVGYRLFLGLPFNLWAIVYS